MKNKAVAILFLFFLLSSCAPKQEIKPVEPPPAQPAAGKPAPPPETAAAEKSPGPAKEQTKKPEQYVMLNFVNADLDNVISTVGEMLKINYILAPGVTGKITIQSHEKIPLSHLFSTFQTILQTNGFTAVKDGDFYKIVTLDTAKQEALPVVEGKKATMPADAGFITQEIPLTYVKASDVANIMRNLMPRGADIVVYEPGNSLIVTAPPRSVLKFLKILQAIDIPPAERDAVRTFDYYVENGEAKKLVEILKNLYASKKEQGGVRSFNAPTPTPGRVMGRPMQPAAATPGATTGGVLEGLAGEIEGPVTIEAYEDINAIVVKTTPRGYISLLQTLKKLDVQPKQVLIEVMIAEVSLDKTSQFGLEWLIKANARVGGEQLGMLGGFDTGSGSLPQFDTSTNKFILPTTGTSSSSSTTTTTTGGTILSHPADVFATIIDPAKFSALITAAAKKGLVHVIASPNILALDNKEAKIEIGDEVPVATSITQPLAGATTTEITATSQVQFKTVGTLLTVTPHINAKKELTLKISQEVSAIGQTVLIGGQQFTGFTTRKANTTAIVQDGHTLVLGGIIQENENNTREGIPFLSDIPILGYLFGTTSNHTTKSELVVMVTPHVISSTEDADQLTREVTRRVKELRDQLKERKEQMQSNSEMRRREDSGR